jgi:hypothetical protein
MSAADIAHNLSNELEEKLINNDAFIEKISNKISNKSNDTVDILFLGGILGLGILAMLMLSKTSVTITRTIEYNNGRPFIK